ncbi:Beta-galactosidase [Caenorhabditis elegans]|uniref:Beta-galactosidase n=1 Tax=Caenorhabditis elegans TaxID=6239 RepID=Q27526_CAEEL|nr:Beta-galactosidase [Caenorhabditis elegans]CAA98542.2 Beta-galactosidase [Caenorhabditis elegans]|eukprot:NP_505849.2 Beta-galactosidase [Caenorhabditis elegans]
MELWKSCIFLFLNFCIQSEGIVRTSYGNWNIPKIGDRNIPSFLIDESKNQFLLDGLPFRYISGSIHYFRIPRDRWDERLGKVRALGFNAIQYYIPWNMHELEEGNHDFSGLLDFAEFSMMAFHKYGLWTILRVGPYICGELENGGLPWWLLNKNVTKQRSSDRVFTREVENWFEILLPRVKPLLRKNGGPVLMLQIENEYGSYDACDQQYLRFLRDLTRSLVGDDVLLFTTDGSAESLLKCGTVEGVFPTVDFGPTDDAKEIENNFKLQRKFAPNGPLVNSEYYPGWLVLWGQKKQNLPSPQTIINGSQTMYSLGASFNYYMIHGGTNFGFWNGAETEAPCITSYDYDAPISESGDVTTKYLEIRKWIKGLTDWPTPPLDVPGNSPKGRFGKIKMRLVHSVEKLKTLTSLGDPGDCVETDKPISFETLKHPLGLVAYQAKINSCGNLTIPSFGDFVHVYLNGKYIDTLTRRYYNLTRNSVIIEGCLENEENRLFMLVENQGRKTFETINDRKGILSDVFMNGQAIQFWTQCGIKLPLQEDFYFRKAMRNNYRKNVKSNQKQGVFIGILSVDAPTDTWLDTTGWGKGIAIVNGRNFGRYWPTKGPQMTLYIPAEFLKIGENSVMMVELEGAEEACTSTSSCIADFIDHPVFDFQ